MVQDENRKNCPWPYVNLPKPHLPTYRCVTNTRFLQCYTRVCEGFAIYPISYATAVRFEIQTTCNNHRYFSNTRPVLHHLARVALADQSRVRTVPPEPISQPRISSTHNPRRLFDLKSKRFTVQTIRLNAGTVLTDRLLGELCCQGVV